MTPALTCSAPMNLSSKGSTALHPTHHLHISTGFVWVLLMFLFLTVVAVFWHRWLKRQDDLARRRLELEHELRLERARQRDAGTPLLNVRPRGAESARAATSSYPGADNTVNTAPQAFTPATAASPAQTCMRPAPVPAPAPAYGGGYSGGELAGAMLLGGVVGAALESGHRDTVVIEEMPLGGEPAPRFDPTPSYDSGASFDSGISYDSGSSYDSSGSSDGFDCSW